MSLAAILQKQKQFIHVFNRFLGLQLYHKLIFRIAVREENLIFQIVHASLLLSKGDDERSMSASAASF
jgi:hypothetical protein